MKTLGLIGAQWGDEGKGKIADVLAERADIIARFAGGANAGHSIVVDGKKTVLHLIPSGVLREGKVCVIGNGVVMDPDALAAEMEALERAGLDVKGRILVSDRAHLTFPFHIDIDKQRETARADNPLGTTLRGIGPTYEDKIARIGLRVGEILDPQRCRSAVEAAVNHRNKVFKALYGVSPHDAKETWNRIERHLGRLRDCVTDTVVYLNDALKAGKSVLFEAAQGTLLDIDHGTYPYCTSSSTTAGGICTGLGIPPKSVEYVAGVAKAYTTRVGEGPFPTELKGQEGVRLREEGVEFGATTGRPRRCGWFDAMLVRHAVMINGLDGMIVTKLDVLDKLDKLPVCVGYELGGRKIQSLPASAEDLAAAKPIYEEIPGWKADTSKARTWKDLPKGAQRYLDFLADNVGCPVIMVSVGSARDAVVWVKDNLLR